MDDLLVTGNDTNFLDNLIQALANRFSLKNLASPHYFLGIEIIPTKTCLFFSQHKVICDILEYFDMERVKTTLTPLFSITQLKLDDGFPHTKATSY